MKRVIVLLASAALVATAALASPGAQAATPPDGTVGADGDSVSWTGEFLASNPLVCVSADDPTCDHFLLEVDPSQTGYTVRIGVAADVETDDIDLGVYDEKGDIVAIDGGNGGSHYVELPNLEAGTYEVRVQPWVVNGPARYTGVADFTVDGNTERSLRIDQGANGCLEAVPAEVGVSGVTDPGDDISLDVLVLIDGVVDDGDPAYDADLTDAEVQRAVDAAAEHSYGPLDIELNVTYERVLFPSDGIYDGFYGPRPSANSQRLIDDAKAHVGGARAAGVDLVYVATAKDIWASEQDDGVLGQADCIGGVRFDDTAFAVGEAGDLVDDPFTIAGLTFYTDNSAKILAHEMGHLMGAHHHYGSCPGGVSTADDLQRREADVCSLMFPLVDFLDLRFGTLDGATVRGHADHWARP